MWQSDDVGIIVGSALREVGLLIRDRNVARYVCGAVSKEVRNSDRAMTKWQMI